MSLKRWLKSQLGLQSTSERSSDKLESKAEEVRSKDLRTSDSEPEERKGCRALGISFQKEEEKGSDESSSPNKGFFRSLANRLCGKSLPTHPGLCGLVNIGNTCFMNSALQCLSNAQPLREYFIGEEAVYKEHINRENPLGCGGAIAEAYGILLQHMWSGKFTTIKPQQMKEAVEKYAPQFMGCAQQDAQELLTFLLDGIHEDLNLVKIKPYSDTVKTEEGGDEDIAEEYWYNYLRRNQSVIVRVFQGQLKSTLVCSLCQKATKIFDPFTFLSLPLPIDEIRNVCIHLIKTENPNGDVEIHMYKLKVIAQGCVFSLKRVLSRLTKISTNMMVVVVYNSDSRMHHVYDDSEPLSHISDEANIFLLELGHPLEDQHWIQVAVYHESLTGYYRRPMMVSIPREQCTYRHLYETVRDKSSTCPRVHTKKLADEEMANPMHNQYPGSSFQSTKLSNADVIGTPVDSEAMEVNEAEMKGQKVDDETVDGKLRTGLFMLTVMNSKCKFRWQQLETYNSLTMQMYISCNWTQEVHDFDAISPTCTTHESNIHLTDCLDLFTAKQTTGKENPSWYCHECRDSVQVSRKCDIWKLPDVLIIYLKRFSCDGRQKVDEEVDFPICDLNLAPYIQNPKFNDPEPIYDLFATINHFGGLAEGHYAAYCKNSETGKWYLFDDTEITEIKEMNHGTSTTYLLFYLRRSGHAIPRNLSLIELFDAEICKLEAKLKSANTFNTIEERNKQVAEDDIEIPVRATKRKAITEDEENKRKKRGNKYKKRKRGKKRKNKRRRKRRR